MSKPIPNTAVNERKLPGTENGPKIIIDGMGIFVTYGENSTRPFESLSELDVVTVANELHREPKDLLFLETLRERITRPLKTSEKILEPLTIESEDKTAKFTPEAALSGEYSPCGFIAEKNQDWIAAETAYLYGKLRIGADEKDAREALTPVIVSNHNGLRSVKLLEGAIFNIGGKAVKTRARSLGEVGFSTLMDLDAIRRFIAGENIDIHQWYQDIVNQLKVFSSLDFDPRLYKVVPCIIMASFFYDLFGVFPIITLFGPFGSGKGRLLLCITYMGHRGMPAIDPSEAAMFRSIEAWKPFFGIDEFYEIGPKIEMICRAAYKKGQQVPRVDKNKGGQLFVTLSEVFTKLVIASDQLPPPNLLQKGIKVVTQKRKDPNPQRKDPTADDFAEIRTKGYIARLTLVPQIKAAAEALASNTKLQLEGRDFEVWQPVLTIASILQGEVWDNCLSYARETRGEIATETYEELKEVIEAIFEMIRGCQGEWPVIVTPKQIHDVIWEKLKDDYRVTKERQEVVKSGELVESESYDYDTRLFEATYNVQRLGRKYISQLGLKRDANREKGSRYPVEQKQFATIVSQYYPDFPNLHKEYDTLVLNARL